MHPRPTRARSSRPLKNVPVGVQDSRRVAPKQRNHVRELPPLLERDDGERATTARLPVNGEILRVDLYNASAHLISAAIPLILRCVRVVARKGVDGSGRKCSHRGGGLVTGRGEIYLYEVGVPGILADVEVIVAVLLPRRLAIDVSWSDPPSVSLAGAPLNVAREKGSGTQGQGAISDLRYFDARTNREAMGTKQPQRPRDGYYFCWWWWWCLEEVVALGTGPDCETWSCRLGMRTGVGCWELMKRGLSARAAQAHHHPLCAPLCSPSVGSCCMSLAVHKHQRTHAAPRSPPRTGSIVS